MRHRAAAGHGTTHQRRIGHITLDQLHALVDEVQLQVQPPRSLLEGVLHAMVFVVGLGGIRPALGGPPHRELARGIDVEQRLVDAGEQVRVYVPFGPQWFGRLVGGLDDRPAGLGAAVRSLLPGA